MTAGLAVAQPQTIAAPHYGDTLFLFYQDKTFEALTGLMVSQHFGRIAPHDDEAEVLRGGMLLSYGLHREAGEVFARLIERQTTPAVRNRAWYFLAQVRHRRGLDGESQEALSRIEGTLPGSLEVDRQVLQAQLMLARSDPAGAAAVLQAIVGEGDTAISVARFNLGVALVRSGHAAEGQALLQALGQASAANEEQRALRDRANVALGYAELASQRPREAREALQRVRLAGLQSNKALLGYGWAAAELHDPQLALVPWRELAARPDNDAAVLEARIAVPYALAEIGADAQALQGYRQAAEGYEQERAALDATIAAVQGGEVLRELLASNADSAFGSARGIATLPALPHASHLLPLLASDGFQEGWKNLRDLRFMDTNLQQWLDSLGVYTDMLDNRRRAYAERLPAVRERAGAIDLPALQQRRDRLAAALAQAGAEGDALAYASPREEELLRRMGRALGTLARVAGDDEKVDLGDAGDRLRRVAGALTWQRTQAFPARHWEARKTLRDLDHELAEAQARDAALLRAQQDEPAREQAFAARIAALAGRLQALRPVVAQLTQAQQGALQELTVAELREQQERLVGYAAQARLAIAQIHDRAQFARRPDSEPVR